MANNSKSNTNSGIPQELENMESDFDQFNVYSTDYEKEFKVDYTNMNVLLGIVNPLNFKKNEEVNSTELNDELKALVNALHELEACLIKAGPETKIRMSAFGIPEVKACIQARDFAGLKEKLELVIKNVDTSIITLVEYGFHSGIRAKIANVNIDDYLEDSANRNALAGSDTLWTKLVGKDGNTRTSVFKTSTIKENNTKS